MYTYSDLIVGSPKSSYAKVIEASGHWSTYSNAFDFNDSSILTKLIQETGRLCDSYASDLFIEYKYLMKRMEEAGYNYTGEVCLFGLRDMGVDGNSFIESRLTQNPHYGIYEYRAIYRLAITVTEEDYNVDYGVKAKSIKMELVKVY